MPSDDLASLRAYLDAADQADRAPLRDFVLAYFSHTDPTELQSRGPAFLLAQAHAPLRLLQAQPDSSGARIRVFNPSLDEDGFVCENTVVQIIQDDMSFLVDSVTMAVNRHGQVAHRVVHPVLALVRDDQGALLTARTADAQTVQREPVLSFISLECDRLVSAQERASLALELNQALADVKAAVSDWSPMLARLRALREGASATALSSIAQQEGAEFLQWLEDQNFTFLAARDEAFATAIHITRTVLEQFDDAPSWATQHATRLARLRQLLQTITAAPADLASIMVALRELRGLMAVPAPQA